MSNQNKLYLIPLKDEDRVLWSESHKLEPEVIEWIGIV
jgi:hypothetical protein